MPIRAVIFDKDGTLLDFNATYGRAAYKIFADLAGGDAACFDDLARVTGFDVEAGAFHEKSLFVAHATNDYAPLIAERLAVTCDDAFMRRIDGLVEHHSLADVTLFDGVAAALARLAAAGRPVGCVTNDTESCARAQLSAAGIGGHFVDIVGYDSGHGRKPDPGQILAVAGTMGIAPDETAYVGDSLHDMHAARAAGSLAIAVTTGLQDAETLAPHSDHVVSDLAGVLDVVGLDRG